MKGARAFVGLLMIATPVFAQGQESHITASNGVIVDLNSDDFAGRYEYTAPIIHFVSDNSSFALVARVVRPGSPGSVHVVGDIYYRGDWRFYEQALYRGGDVAAYRRVGGNVITCSGSTYGGCSLNESFHLDFTPAEIRAHAQNGVLTVQIRGRSGDPLMLDIPISYVDAVAEVSRPRAAAASSTPVQPHPSGK